MMLLGYLIPTRLIQYAVSALAAVGLFFVWLVTHDAKVVQKERVRVAIEGAKTNAKAHAARTAAARPGAVRRLREKSCRDC